MNVEEILFISVLLWANDFIKYSSYKDKYGEF